MNKLKKEEKQNGFPWAGSIFVFLIFYLLALGPMNWLYANGFMFDSVRDFFLVLYVPVKLLVQYNDFAGKILVWYIRLWGG